MDKEQDPGLCHVHGSTNSHTAILARMMNIPALIGVPLELEKIHNGTRAIVDGREAVFYLIRRKSRSGRQKRHSRRNRDKKPAGRIQGT